ncbi:MAG: hypothetical protein MJK04_15075 [Psychrosphaera sp.]|nr:hypothetical protein [Psychrosphaera sp.]
MESGANELKYLTYILSLLIGFFSLLVGFFTFQINKQKVNDEWLKSFNELHQSFWQEPDFAMIRAFIANNDEYIKLEKILIKHMGKSKAVTSSEYSSLEQLDKFFNFLLRAREVAKKLHKSELWKNLYFQYWMDEIALSERHYLWIYFNNFYQEDAVLSLLPEIPEEKFQSFKQECAKIQTRHCHFRKR